MNAFPRAANLCEDCEVISFDDSDYQFSTLRAKPNVQGRASLDYHVEDVLPDLPALQRRANAGCDFCRILRNIIISPDPTRPNENGRELLSRMRGAKVELLLEYIWSSADLYEEQGGPNMMTLEATLVLPSVVGEKEQAEEDREEGNDNDGPEITFKFLVGGSGPNHSIVPRWLNLLAPTPLIDRFEEDPIEWIDLQMDLSSGISHGIDVRKGFLPDRLLDLRHDTTRLVSRKEVEEAHGVSDLPGKAYAALSYCWGEGKQLLTTLESLEARRKAISPQEISPLLRDAIQLARLLSIPYLWIDALCIIQGDDRDWNHQSSQMGLIYRNASLTIAVAATGSCEHGFRNNQREILHIPFESQVNPEVFGLFSLRYLCIDHWPEIDIYQYSRAEIDESAWASRRWTFQEQFLSHRIVLFTAGELYFTSPEGMMNYSTENVMEPLLLFEDVLTWDFWHTSLLFHYTRRRGVSRHTDVLPALSGLSDIFARVHELSSSDYVAGLWNGNLHIGLAWQCGGDHLGKLSSVRELLERLLLPTQYLAPSWSWASRGRVESIMDSLSQLSPHKKCTHLRASTILRGENQFGEVQAGILQSTALTADFSGNLVRKETENWVRWYQPWYVAGSDRPAWEFMLDWDPREGIVSLNQVKMVLIGTGKNRNRGTVVDFGILLHEAGSAHPGKFVRIGIFRSMTRPKYAGFTLQSLEVV